MCTFGVPAADSLRRFALVGDSHAMHWRAALAGVARAKRWEGVSIARGHCPLSLAVKDLPPEDSASCEQWKRAVLRWFSEHPEVHTVFVGQVTSRLGVRRARGETAFGAEVAGYRRAWAALPPSVKHIVVLRDSPRAPRRVTACVERAMRRHQAAGSQCAAARRDLLLRDPAAVAARRSGARVRLADFTRFFCGRRLCWPVIGGALVYKDSHHMTRVYSATLSPFVSRWLDRARLG